MIQQRAVFLVQGKYRKTLDSKIESRSDIVAFAELAARLHCQDDEEFRAHLSDMDAAVAERLRTARRKVLNDKYRSWLYFVTTGKVGPTVRKDVQQQVRRASEHSRIEVIDGKARDVALSRLSRWSRPAHPYPRSGDGSWSDVTVNGVSQRYDKPAHVESWVFSMRGDAVATLYEKAGLRLFARNIRGFMGTSTPVNQGMLATLKKEPARFFYYNNGITILCDEAERKSSKGRDILQVGNPQVINGQQTTRMLAQSPQQAAKASVLVKVIRVPRDPEGDASCLRRVWYPGSCRERTGRMRSSRPTSCRTTEGRLSWSAPLRKVGYLYLRKRQSKEEALKISGRGQYHIITKDELAQAVAGCELDPAIIRSGRERLFTEEHYTEVFPNADPNYYLPKYRLMREVTKVARGIPARGYAKWLVLHFMWSQVSALTRGAQKSRAFRILCEQQSPSLVGELRKAIEEVFVEVMRYFRETRGAGRERTRYLAVFQES